METAEFLQIPPNAAKRRELDWMEARRKQLLAWGPQIFFFGEGLKTSVSVESAKAEKLMITYLLTQQAEKEDRQRKRTSLWRLRPRE